MAKKRGQPTKYTEEIGNTICERLSNGESLVKICQDEGMPPRATVYGWITQQEEFSNKYTRAREGQGHYYADDVDEILQRMYSGEIDAQKARVAIDARKWQSGKLLPGVYGDRVNVDHSGEFKVVINGDDAKL